MVVKDDHVAHLCMMALSLKTLPLKDWDYGISVCDAWFRGVKTISRMDDGKHVKLVVILRVFFVGKTTILLVPDAAKRCVHHIVGIQQKGTKFAKNAQPSK